MKKFKAYAVYFIKKPLMAFLVGLFVATFLVFIFSDLVAPEAAELVFLHGCIG